MPFDLNTMQVLAIVSMFGAWFSYSAILKLISSGSLNDRLSLVRTQWIANSVNRPQKPFDAILLGNIVSSISFFGSATLLVLAGLFAFFTHSKAVYDIILSLPFEPALSYEEFVLQMAIVNATLAISFFSFTYALRKVTYVIALIGALPSGDLNEKQSQHVDKMVESAAIVLTEALKTFNFGIRGYYYFIAALGLVVSPYLSLGLTAILTFILFYRQLGSKTAKAIDRFVTEAGNLNEK